MVSPFFFLRSVTREEEYHSDAGDFDPDRYFGDRNERYPYYVSGYGRRLETVNYSKLPTTDGVDQEVPRCRYGVCAALPSSGIHTVCV